MVNVLRRDDDLRLLVVFRLSRRVNFTPPGNKEEKTLNLFLFLTSSSSSFFGRDDSRLLDARDARFSSVTSVSKLLVLLLLLLLLLFVACALKKCRRRFDDASGVRKVNKTLALKASLFGTRKGINEGCIKSHEKAF